MEQQENNNPSMLRIGTILRGVYRIDSYLASGGFGKTYVATNIEFNERVAIKEFFIKDIAQRDSNTSVISVTNGENHELFAEQKEKFKKEARRMRQLNNPHIVRVHDLFEENGTAYYVMDYIDGENLSRRLERTGRPMSESEVRSILPQILDALKTVHDANIWHLDLKPSNIMLDKSGNVKLIDFGASKQLNTQKGGATTGTRISYTPGFAPREQMEQNYDKFGPWTDIYALGATLYSLLTNKRPPLPTDIDDDISEDKHNALPFPESVSGMKNLVLQMMKTNRMQRPQSIYDIICVGKIKEESKQAQEQQPTSQKTTAFDDEATATADPKFKIEENKQECKPKPELVSRGSEERNNGHTSDEKSTTLTILSILKRLGLSFLISTIIIFSIIFLTQGSVDFFQELNGQNVETLGSRKVTRMNYQTAIGGCQYSGPVDEDNIPHGIGEAFFNDGRYYKGNFSHGNMTGKDAYFKYANDDVFKGEFRDNTFYEGTYTIAADGSYFVGYYKKGKPDSGNWYDKNGNVIQ